MHRYYENCFNWPPADVRREGGLCDMIDGAIDITRRTFLAYVDREELKELAAQLGYEDHRSRGLTMAGDYHISYHRSKLHGKRVYFFKWSGIEYVFTQEQREAKWQYDALRVSQENGSTVSSMESSTSTTQHFPLLHSGKTGLR